MNFNIEASCMCSSGRVRSSNEDNFYFNRKHMPALNKGLNNPIDFEGTTAEPVVMAVADGMGGESRGEEAACIVCETLAEEYGAFENLIISGKEYFLKACFDANDKVNNAAKEKQVTTMGTTMAGLHFFQNEVVACNVGDSRIFRIRDNQMYQVSEDHTDEKIIRAMGINKAPVLLQYIGISQKDMVLDPFISRGEIKVGDIYVICSDGVSDFINAGDMYSIISGSVSANEAVSRITAYLDAAGGADNATVIVIKVK